MDNMSQRNNADPKFSEVLVPIHVWFLETVHNVMDNESLKQLTFVPKHILQSALKSMGLEGTTTEVHAYVLAHDIESHEYHAYVGHMHRLSNGKLELAFSNLVDKTPEEGLPDLERSLKMSELGIQFRPDWKGVRNEPTLLEAGTLTDMIDLLESHNRKDDFMTMFPKTSLERPPLPPPMATMKVKDVLPKTITKIQRKKLVEKFGEANIAKLEAKLATKQEIKLEKKINKKKK